MTIDKVRHCLVCGEVLTFTMGRGWVHQGGGVYVMRCRECNWKGSAFPSPRACPDCGRVDTLRDDHCAQPRFT